MRKNYIKPKYDIIQTEALLCLAPTSGPNINTDGPVVGGGGSDNIEELAKEENNDLWEDVW